MPPIDLSQLSPRRTRSSRSGRKAVSKSASVNKPRASVSVQLQTDSKKEPRFRSSLNSRSVDAQKRKEIAREIKMRVQKNPAEIASEIKRRVQQKTKEVTSPDVNNNKLVKDYVDLSQHQSTQRSYAALTSFRGYDRYKEMSPRIHRGDMSCWQCLPEELWLMVLSFLPLADLHSFMLTCHDFNRLSHDRSLWNSVTITKKQLSDEEIIKLGYLHPSKLSFLQCTGVKVNGDMVTNWGLRKMFESCGKDLKHLSTASCVMPPLSGEAMLHHAVLHCPAIHSLDLSWCNLTNRDVELVAENFASLLSVYLNGNQAITDVGMGNLFTQISNHVEHLELQGCFKLTNKSLQEIGGCCRLRKLNIGQCHKFSSSHIMHEVSRLSLLEVCNLKGLKQLRDSCIEHIVKSCPNIQQLVISQCTALTPKSLVEISCASSNLSILDVSSCKDCVNDASICALLANCTELLSLDLSSTHASNHSILAISNSCSKLSELRLNFCSVTDTAIKQLLAQSQYLTKISLYGIKGIQVEELAEINPKVSIEN